MKAGFTGLGGMGKPIAVNIVKAGFEITVNDLRETPVHAARRPGRGQRAGGRRCVGHRACVLRLQPTASEVVALGPTKMPHTRGVLRASAEPAAAEAEFAGRLPIGRFAESEELANAIAFLASGEASFITGSVLDVDGGNNLVTVHVAPGSY